MARFRIPPTPPRRPSCQAAVADAGPGLSTTDLATAQKAAQATADAIGAAK